MLAVCSMSTRSPAQLVGRISLWESLVSNMDSILIMGFCGAGAGLLASMLGIGGGFIIVPMLTVLVGVPMHAAIAASLVAVIATSVAASAVYLRERLVHVRLGLTLEIATTLGALSGALIGTHLDPRLLSLMFGCVLVYVGWSMLRRRENSEEREALASECEVRHLGTGMMGSFVGGALSGLLGIGGGIVKVPVICLIMGMPMRVATATSAFMIGMTAVTGASVYYARGYLDVVVAGSTAAGVVLGAMLGSRLASRVQSRYLRLGFVLVSLYTAVVMVSRGLGIRLW